MPLVLEEHKNVLTLNGETENLRNLTNGYLELAKKNDGLLKSEALAAARGSHAPYSGCPSGVALMDCDGNVYKGCYMESAAYNPSMMPVQAALVAYIVGGGGGYDRIVAAVLVEKEGEGVMVRQEDTARLLLKHISPKCGSTLLHGHTRSRNM
ncbi:cytidine deaminase 1 [Artemisia annua]|uniref:Cytidine deaminase 1 n=1 Tax=Artemisia annua TaxID=35608 RepID=A0A2U1M0G9_ARTAN|nr:cytidine deaminase 1 [Artemisia annua]